MISMKNVVFGFNEPILKDINLVIEDNDQIIGLLGPNGAGKTTLLNTLAGYYQKFSGEVSCEKTFLLPDEEYIPHDLTIEKCLRIFPKLYTQFNVNRAKEMVEFLNLENNKKFGDFSKGMKEQVHILMALAQDVDTYLFDEPLAAVDPYNRKILIELIQKFRRNNSNVIISTHLIEDIHNLFEEVIFLKEGKIILHESVQNLMKGEKQERLEEKYLEVMANDGYYQQVI
ncbi:ATP-binding cassette domain-containing protein [Pediococcus acidilactici]|uniref:ATP-binding cassette domain-containing protein n=1 Tax=Pediococcus acidilactici TaxID=1254 RepID=UPI000FFE2DAD|nr:ABC transporter ATP-binding protein [Pediococcus acidilactici]QAT20863.1 ABC transporter ATP-binding protein [Pediococcus acidilactici]